MGELGMSSASREAGWEGSLLEEPGQRSVLGLTLPLLQDPSKYECGQTKVFFRAGQVAVLEERRARSPRAARTRLQRHLRGRAVPAAPHPGPAGPQVSGDTAGDRRQRCRLWAGLRHGCPRGVGHRLCHPLPRALCPRSHPSPCSLPSRSGFAVPSLGSATPCSALSPLPGCLPGSLPSPQVREDAAEDQGCRGAAEDPEDGPGPPLVPGPGRRHHPGLRPGPVCPVPVPRGGSPAGQGVPGSPLGVPVVPPPCLCPRRWCGTARPW